MISIIRNHNRLNGLRFSVAEFLLVALLTLGFGGYCLVAGRVALGVVGVGIGANSLAVVAIGVGSLRAGETDVGLRTALSAAGRSRIQQEAPHLQRDTYLLAGATLLPGLVAALVIVERLRSHPGGG